MCGIIRVHKEPYVRGENLFRLAYETGISGDFPPMRPIPMVLGPDRCVLTRWGWPDYKPGKIKTHARSETANHLSTWRDAWESRRGVVPVAGWDDGGWTVASPGAHLAVLWIEAEDGPRLAILTQDGGPYADRIERFPCPLTQAGALAWLAGGDLRGQVTNLRVTGKGGQQTIFDA